MTISSIGGVLPAFNANSSGSITRTGTVQDANNGSGSFTTTVTRQNGTVTIDQTIQYTSGKDAGKTVQRESVLTRNADGTISDTITTTLANGKTFTRNETITPDAATGTATITGTYTNAQGKSGSLSGTIDRSGGGVETQLTYTNQAGKTETLNSQRVLSGNTLTNTVSGTNFAGGAISDTIVDIYA